MTNIKMSLSLDFLISLTNKIFISKLKKIRHKMTKKEKLENMDLRRR